LVLIDDVRPAWLDAARLLKQAVPAGIPVLLTTRNEGLARNLDAVVHRLDALLPNEALALLKAHAGAAVVEAEGEAAERLLAEVGYLPLAIELAGKRLAMLARKPGPQLATFGEAVAQRATETLTLEGHPGLAATFALTYEALSPDSQGLFRWLGVFSPGLLQVTSVAGVLGVEVEIAEQGLDALEPLALVGYGQTAGTYTLHPLLRQYAQTLLVEAGCVFRRK
jgi:hypothetical protein